MQVNVRSEIVIARPRVDVAAYAGNLDNTTAWYGNIRSVEWKTEPPAVVGSRIAFVAQFLGRRLAYTYEVRELVPDERMVMSTADGPFAMETTYEWADAPAGTRMTLTNRGAPSGFATLTAPMMVRAMRRANREDLERLKAILESP